MDKAVATCSPTGEHKNSNLLLFVHLSYDMRFPTMWYVKSVNNFRTFTASFKILREIFIFLLPVAISKSTVFPS